MTASPDTSGIRPPNVLIGARVLFLAGIGASSVGREMAHRDTARAVAIG